MIKIVFIINNDSNHNDILIKGGGNSEFKLYRLAKELADRDLNIVIYNTSNINSKLDNIEYKSYTDILNGNIILNIKDIIVIFRHYDTVPILRKFYDNKCIVWTGDYLVKTFSDLNLSSMEFISKDTNTIIVPVSKFGQNNVEDHFKRNNITPPRIQYIYNCVFTKHFINKKYTINNNNIVFGSAWGKGLSKIIELFDKLIIKHPNFKLVLMRPNYDKSDIPDRDYIILLDTINTKSELSEVIGSSLCVMTSEFPETFGNLFAESYYLNTPVIATDTINGLHEIINNSHICNFNKYDEFEKLILSFYENRPFVELNPQFYEENIINEWIDLFNKL